MATEHGNLSINSDNIFPIIKKWMYSDHDIFFRELISNGCDAITKLKKLALMGEYNEPDDIKYNINVKVSDETSELCTISVKLEFEKRECTFEFVINTDYTLESGAINPSYTTGEKMGKAGMNTLIGMGTVFVVLIFISFIISLFKYISVYENRKKEQKEDTASVGVDNAIAQIVSNEEENVEDDLELIAVITAAIAASEGTSTDGLVVRSIRKVNNRRK